MMPKHDTGNPPVSLNFVSQRQVSCCSTTTMCHNFLAPSFLLTEWHPQLGISAITRVGSLMISSFHLSGILHCCRKNMLFSYFLMKCTLSVSMINHHCLELIRVVVTILHTPSTCYYTSSREIIILTLLSKGNNTSHITVYIFMQTFDAAKHLYRFLGL